MDGDPVFGVAYPLYAPTGHDGTAVRGRFRAVRRSACASEAGTHPGWTIRCARGSRPGHDRWGAPRPPPCRKGRSCEARPACPGSVDHHTPCHGDTLPSRASAPGIPPRPGEVRSWSPRGLLQRQWLSTPPSAPRRQVAAIAGPGGGGGTLACERLLVKGCIGPYHQARGAPAKAPLGLADPSGPALRFLSLLEKLEDGEQTFIWESRSLHASCPILDSDYGATRAAGEPSSGEGGAP